MTVPLGVKSEGDTSPLSAVVDTPLLSEAIVDDVEGCPATVDQHRSLVYETPTISINAADRRVRARTAENPEHRT